MEGKIKSFRDLEVWQSAMRLAELVYALVRTFPESEHYALSSQLRRAVVSIPSNIAEGFGRDTKADYVHFLLMAQGSLYEVSTQLELAERIGYLQGDQTVNIEISALGRRLNAFISRLRASSHR